LRCDAEFQPLSTRFKEGAQRRNRKGGHPSVAVAEQAAHFFTFQQYAITDPHLIGQGETALPPVRRGHFDADQVAVVPGAEKFRIR